MGVSLPDVTLAVKHTIVPLRKRLRDAGGENIIYPPGYATEVADEGWWTNSTRTPGIASTMVYATLFEILSSEGIL